MSTYWVWVVVVILGCKGERPADGAKPDLASTPPPIPSDASVSDSTTQLVVAADASLDDPRSPAARCASACLYLLDVPLAEAQDAFARDCKAPWPYPNDDCEALVYARNCIYAGYGYVFKRAVWKQRFETQPWYRANPKLKERDLSTVALANVRALVAVNKECGKAVFLATPADIKLAMTWFEKLRTGEGIDDGIDIGSFQEHYRNYYIDENATFAYGDTSGATREIVIRKLYYAAGPGRLDESIGIVLVFEGEKLRDYRRD